MVFVHANFAARLSRFGGLRYDSGSSCPMDLRRVHELRETYPAIAVGRRTFELDQPQLTVRAEHLGRAPLSQPRRIILTRSADFRAPLGYRQIRCPAGNLKAGLNGESVSGIDGLLLEAGPTLLSAFLEQRALCALTIYLRGQQPEEMLPALFRLLPALPRNFNLEREGQGHLLTFDLLEPKANVIGRTNDFVVTPLTTTFGEAVQYTFRDRAFGREHGALVYGDPSSSGGCQPPLVRIHSECWTSALMGSVHCECAEQLEEAHRQIAADGRGVLILHNAEGRGIGRTNKTDAYRLQNAQGLDTVAANVCLGLPEDAREYFSAAYLLRRLEVTRVRLLTNNREKAEALRQSGIDVVEQIPLAGFCTESNAAYLAKKVECGHDARLLDAVSADYARSHYQQTASHLKP